MDHPTEFALIICNQRQPCNHRVRSDPEIVIFDHLASRFQLRPNRSVRFGRRFRQRERGQKLHKLAQSTVSCGSNASILLLARFLLCPPRLNRFARKLLPFFGAQLSNSCFAAF